MDKPNYTVMETDYDNYTIVYSCSDWFWGYASFDYLWILSREPTMTDESFQARVQTIQDTLPHYNIMGNTRMATQGEESCPYDEIVRNEKE